MSDVNSAKSLPFGEGRIAGNGPLDTFTSDVDPGPSIDSIVDESGGEMSACVSPEKDAEDGTTFQEAGD